MSDLLTLPHESPERLEDFARIYVETGSVTTAIQKAGVQNPQYRLAVWAQRLLARPDVRALVEIAEREMSERRAAPKEYTRASIAEDFQQIYEQALNAEEFSPAVTAKAKQAELLGLMEKHVNVTFNARVTDMSMESLEAELKRLTDEGVVTLTEADYTVVEESEE